jgi:hypothetical protein
MECKQKNIKEELTLTDWAEIYCKDNPLIKNVPDIRDTQDYHSRHSMTYVIRLYEDFLDVHPFPKELNVGVFIAWMNGATILNNYISLKSYKQLIKSMQL